MFRQVTMVVRGRDPKKDSDPPERRPKENPSPQGWSLFAPIRIGESPIGLHAFGQACQAVCFGVHVSCFASDSLISDFRPNKSEQDETTKEGNPKVESWFASPVDVSCYVRFVHVGRLPHS